MVVSIYLSWKSLGSRFQTVVLTVATIAISVFLFLSVERIRSAAQQSFERSISGIDLIVGARTSPLHLLLFSAFQIGDPTHNISFGTYERYRQHPDVAWAIPLSYGDSYRGFRVIGTDESFFRHMRYAGQRQLALQKGQAFQQMEDMVVGAQVASALKIGLGEMLHLSHGGGEVSFHVHDHIEFRVVGILEPTATPLDRALYISLAAVNALHQESSEPIDEPDQQSSESNDHTHAHEHEHEHEHEHAHSQGVDERPPSAEINQMDLSAIFVAVRSKFALFSLQRLINDDAAEPLTAILPALTLQQLMGFLGVLDQALQAISILVVMGGLLGMLATILTSLNERRREMAILRTLGARPSHIISLMVLEALLLAALGIFGGWLLMSVIGLWLQSYLSLHLGLEFKVFGLSLHEAMVFGLIIALAAMGGLLPAWQAYRRSLIDGLSPRL
jgi:putative ABC transport system permease protein